MSPTTDHVHTTLIIGAGFAGLGAAIRLRESGIEDVVILERADSVGGTWRDNTYPGAACDIPSLLYSYSFSLKPDWSRAYSGSNEILGYIEAMVDKFDLAPLIQFGKEVKALEFDEAAGHWKVRTTKGRDYLARTIVVASGPLSDASLPDIRGIDTFEGHKILSAHWDHDYDLAGKRVAVIGTGASAIQIIPEVVRQAEKVKVFQRTPGWVLPRVDYSTPEVVSQLFRRLPMVQTLARNALFCGHEVMATGLVWDSPVTTGIQKIAAAHLRHQVSDPWMRRQLTPDFRAGCKRMLMSNDYYPALQAENCKLVSWPIATICPSGIRTCDGVEHHFDAIIFATGYDVHKAGTPYQVTGLDGRNLNEEWAKGAFAYKSANVSGYPNLFFTFGPNSGPGHNSALVYMQGQLDYAVKGIRTIVESDLRYLDVRAGAQERYNASIQRRLRKTTWNSGCSSWYLTEDGYNPSMYPGFATQYLAQMKNFRTRDYELVERTARGQKLQRAGVA